MMTPPKSMLTPAPGFTTRVLSRIETYEHARARRRALIGAIVLVVAAMLLIAFVAFSLATWLFAFADQPSIVTTLVTMLVGMFDRARIVFDAFWVAGVTIGRQVDQAVWVAYAVLALALTMLWTRVVVGLPRFASITVRED